MTGHDLECLFSRVEALGFDFLLASDSSFTVKTVAENIGVPMLSFSTGIPLLKRPHMPPEFTLWSGKDTLRNRARNRVANGVKNIIEWQTLERINRVRRELSMKPHKNLTETISDIAYLMQMSANFDLPISKINTPTHYLGPTLDPSSREGTIFPWDKLDGRPMIYVSSGTLVDEGDYFRQIAEACVNLHVQLVITRGGGTYPLEGELAGDPLIVDYAPQLEVLKKASLVITHGSLNTIIESLANGVPLVCIPQVFDQFGTAVRASRAGVAITLSPYKLAVLKVREAIAEVLSKAQYTDAAQAFKKYHDANCPLTRAVSIIESTIDDYLSAERV